MAIGLQATIRRIAARMARRFDPDRAVVAREFDRAHYLSLSPDVAAAGRDPLDHFMAHGWREGRDPNPDFSVREYLNNNPDVAASGENPFAHYLKTGRAEGRIAVQDLGFRPRILARLRPIEDEIAAVSKATLAMRPDGTRPLIDALAAASADVHLTFSHDDYRTHVGGTQLCLQQEELRVRSQGRDHLHISPPIHWPVVRAGEEGLLSVLLNGRPVGTFRAVDIASALRGARPGARTLAIHSLLGHAIDETLEIVQAAGVREGFFWLHDYASLCAGYNLLRNRVEDCGAPPPESAACGICLFGPWRGRHLAAHEELFARLPLTVVAPARSTLAFWQASWTFPVAGALVHPHAQFVARGPAPLSAGERPLRVAFVGFPSAHKGWPIFQRLAARHAADPRYEFFHFGAQSAPGAPLAFHDVSVSAERPQAMQAALEAHDIDVLVFWPLWRETFSFAVYEAIAAGCAVITGPDSGNVAAVVAETGCGWVLAGPEALDAAFASGEAAKLARARRAPMLYDLKMSGMTADLLPAKAET